MSSRDNINELWDATPFESFLKTPNGGSDHSVGFTDASQDLTSYKGISEETYKKQKVSLQQKVGFLYGIQGAEMQKGFLVRPPAHHVVDGVVDPSSPADAQRQRKAYQDMIKEERENRKLEADKKAKEEADIKAKENEERRKKEEELRKTEEEKKQKAEKAEKEEARRKAQDEKEKIQKSADEEGLKADRDFLIADAKAHMNPEGTFPKRNDNSRIVIVTPLYDEVGSKKGDLIKNRAEYCNKHDYVCLFPELNTIIDKKYNRWKAVYLLQKMLFKSTDIKEGDWVWYLEPSVVITNLSTPIGDILLQPDSLKARLSYGSRFLSGKNHYHPTVRFPKSVEKANIFEMIVAREPRGFITDSFFVKNTERMRFWLDMWSDHVVAGGVSRNEDAFIQGDSLQHLYLNHYTLRDVTAVVTPRLLISFTTNAYDTNEFLGYHVGDITTKFSCTEKSGCMNTWKTLLDISNKSSDSNNVQASTDGSLTIGVEAEKSKETKPAEQNAPDAEKKKQEEADAQQIEHVKEQAAQALQESQKNQIWDNDDWRLLTQLIGVAWKYICFNRRW